MDDPIYLFHALIAATLFVMGSLLITAGIPEGADVKPPDTPEEDPLPR